MITATFIASVFCMVFSLAVLIKFNSLNVMKVVVKELLKTNRK